MYSSLTVNRATKRMLNPPVWHQLCEALSASFVVCDPQGNEVHRLIELNDNIQIDIPGPVSMRMPEL